MKAPEFGRQIALCLFSAACLTLPTPHRMEAGASSTETESPHENFIPPNVRTPAEEPFPGVFASYAGETVYLIRCGEKSVLVDTGYLHNTDSHLDNFEAAGVDLDTIAVIFATHPHVDHVAGLAHAIERLKCPVVAHKNAVHIIERGDRVLSAAYMPFLGWDFPFPACEVDEAIDDGDTLEVGDITFTVVHTPGHTPGCVSYLWDGKMISGDVLFASGRIGWMDAHWGSNFHDMLDTLDRIDKIAPAHLLPTHGAPFPYDPSITQKARETSTLFLDHKNSGVLGQTRRAELRDPESATRTLRF